MFEQASSTIDLQVQTAPRFPATSWGAAKTLHLEGPESSEHEPILPDSDVPMTFIEMAAELRKIGTPSPERVELSVDPDDYPLF